MENKIFKAMCIIFAIILVVVVAYLFGKTGMFKLVKAGAIFLICTFIYYNLLKEEI